MSDSIGVQPGRLCPSCGQEDSVPVIWGLPDAAAGVVAERGFVVLGGCVVDPAEPALACRSCGLRWGHASDPTVDEQELADLLGVRHLDVVRALGTGWRRASTDDDVRWFVSGEPAQWCPPRWCATAPVTSGPSM